MTPKEMIDYYTLECTILLSLYERRVSTLEDLLVWTGKE